MRHRLPVTYLDIVKSPSLVHWLKMSAVLFAARLLGFWNKPRPLVVEESEWTLLDEAHFSYKYIKPLTSAEKGVHEVLFSDDRSVVRLPSSFEAKNCLTVGAAGDLMPAEGLEQSRDIIFENVADLLFDVDVSFANLEGPVSDTKFDVNFIGGNAPHILGFTRSEFESITAHKGKNFKLLSFANNHSFDKGIEGLDTTHDMFSRHGIVAIGTPMAPTEYGRATIVTEKGIKIGFVSATYSLNGLNPPVDAAHRIHVTDLVLKPDLEILRKQIIDCKRHNCDFIIASIHWGQEAEFFPRKYQTEVAHTLVEEGVDLILGHHPHVIQPIEYYRTKRDRDRIAVIAYSLGGLGMRWYTAPHFALGLILNLKISKGVIDGIERTYIESVRPVPVFQNIFLSYYADIRIKRLEKLEDHVKEGESGALHGYAMKIKKYADLVLPETKQ
ncbi:CapA family protein [Mesorhizobium sp.]|uniref:CapA family protein n=1 Tax=Mesorhizobium sp. TaxID=1871066 RepID=UPI0025FF21C9|nr:CapA family protein [Mesorhizobium sp.]